MKFGVSVLSPRNILCRIHCVDIYKIPKTYDFKVCTILVMISNLSPPPSVLENVKKKLVTLWYGSVSLFLS